MKKQSSLKKTLLFIISIILSVCIIISATAFFILSPISYASNANFDAQTNKEIKSLILTSVKDLFLVAYSCDSSDIYSSPDDEKIIQNDADTDINKSLIFIIDRNFMKSIKKTGDNTYSGIVKTYFPSQYFCHIEIIDLNNEYKISSFQLDI